MEHGRRAHVARTFPLTAKLSVYDARRATHARRVSPPCFSQSTASEIKPRKIHIGITYCDTIFACTDVVRLPPVFALLSHLISPLDGALFTMKPNMVAHYPLRGSYLASGNR